MSRRKQERQGFAQHLSLAISLAILIGVAGTIAYFALSPEYATPPDITLERGGEIRHVGSQWYVPYRVRNRGGRAAENVHIEGILTVPGEAPRRAPQELDYVAGFSLNDGELVFDIDPRSGTLVLRVLSLQQP